MDGIEHLILKGAKNFLKHKKIREIVVEVNPRHELQSRLIEMILKKNGFKKVIATNKRLFKDSNYRLTEDDMLNTIFRKV